MTLTILQFSGQRAVRADRIIHILPRRVPLGSSTKAALTITYQGGSLVTAHASEAHALNAMSEIVALAPGVFVELPAGLIAARTITSVERAFGVGGIPQVHIVSDVFGIHAVDCASDAMADKLHQAIVTSWAALLPGGDVPVHNVSL